MRSWKRFCGVVEAIPSGGVVAPGFAVNSPQFFASKRPQFLPQSGHDRTTIGSQSGHDRGLIVILGLRRSPSDPVEAIPR